MQNSVMPKDFVNAWIIVDPFFMHVLDTQGKYMHEKNGGLLFKYLPQKYFLLEKIVIFM